MKLFKILGFIFVLIMSFGVNAQTITAVTIGVNNRYPATLINQQDVSSVHTSYYTAPSYFSQEVPETLVTSNTTTSTPTCPAGYSLSGSTCVQRTTSTPTCPAGSHFQFNWCLADNTFANNGATGSLLWMSKNTFKFNGGFGIGTLTLTVGVPYLPCSFLLGIHYMVNGACTNYGPNVIPVYKATSARVKQWIYYTSSYPMFGTAPTCPAGSTFNSTSGLCEKFTYVTPTYVCPSGYSLTATNSCIKYNIPTACPQADETLRTRASTNTDGVSNTVGGTQYYCTIEVGICNSGDTWTGRITQQCEHIDRYCDAPPANTTTNINPVSPDYCTEKTYTCNDPADTLNLNTLMCSKPGSALYCPAGFNLTNGECIRFSSSRRYSTIH